jgi:hypothetical protein
MPNTDARRQQPPDFSLFQGFSAVFGRAGKNLATSLEPSGPESRMDHRFGSAAETAKSRFSPAVFSGR